MRANPVVIIGAPRSGTNILRNVVTRLPQIGTWPCDEINYIWRHGNARYPTDEFTADMATKPVQRYIRGQFDRIARRYQLETIIEKTCANSLRVEFVDRVLPEARYIFIRRNGFDAVSSAMLRWRATNQDLSYLMRKARFVPPSDFVYYAGRYFGNRLHRVFSSKKRLAFWGPRIPDMQNLLANYSLEEICAMQWKACVDNASTALGKLPSDKVIELEYERFVTHPVQEIQRIVDFMGWNCTEQDVFRSVADVSASSLGRGQREMCNASREKIAPIINDAPSLHGYA